MQSRSVSLVALAFVVLISGTYLFADDLMLTNGDVVSYEKVKRTEPDGIIVACETGPKKILFTKMAATDQKKFGFDPQKADEFKAAKLQAEISSQAAAVQSQTEQLEQKLTSTPEVRTPEDTDKTTKITSQGFQQDLPKDFLFKVPGHPANQNHSSDYETLKIMSKEQNGLMVENETGNHFVVRIEQLPPEIRKAYGYP